MWVQKNEERLITKEADRNTLLLATSFDLTLKKRSAGVRSID